MSNHSSAQLIQPTTPLRSTSLHRRCHKRASSLATGAKANATASTSTPVVISSSNNGSPDKDDDDDIVYVLTRHIVNRKVPMDVQTELVPFHELPIEAQKNPTTIMTWARQTPEFLFLETIVPPQCKVCLATLEDRIQKPPMQVLEISMQSYDEGNTPFVDSFEELPNQYSHFTNPPTPALLIPGNYLWDT